MPESKTRKGVRPASSTKTAAAKAHRPTPTWYKIIMFSLMVIGLLWIICFYITSVTPGMIQLPVPPLGPWNIAVGFGIVIVGFIMTIGWRN